MPQELSRAFGAKSDLTGAEVERRGEGNRRPRTEGGNKPIRQKVTKETKTSSPRLFPVKRISGAGCVRFAIFCARFGPKNLVISSGLILSGRHAVRLHVLHL